MKTTNEPALADLSDLAHCRDDEIDLGHAALRIALVEYPWLSLTRYMAEFDRLSKRAVALAPGLSDDGLIDGINRALFSEAGFRGNAENYYDPRNSFLNDVLERHLGIPITLSVVYIEVGRRLGLNLVGVGMPGHFLVGHTVGDTIELIDAFNEGRRLERERCRELVEHLLGPSQPFRDDMLAPVPTRLILVRMLTNLKIIYRRSGDLPRAIAIMDRILQLVPHAAGELRDRGLTHLQLEHPSRAVRDLEAYLEIAPESPDRAEILQAIAAARRAMASWN